MGGADLLVVVASVALLAAGFVLGLRTGSRGVVRRALSAPAPEVRRAAVRLAAHAGLAEHVRPLLQLTRSEGDRRVLATLAEAVAGVPPGPDDPPLLDELRLWARSYPQVGPAPGAGRGLVRDLSWLLPVVLCNVAAAVGAAVGTGLGGTSVALAASALFAGVVLVAYLASGPGTRARSRAGRPAASPGPAPPPARPVAVPSPPEEPSALETLTGPAPPRDDVIDLRAPSRSRVEAPLSRDRSAAETFWDVNAPDEEVREVLARRERPAAGRRVPWRRPGRGR